MILKALTCTGWKQRAGRQLKLDSSLIVPKGADSYEFTDIDVTNRKTYYYKLESIAADGAPTLLA